MEYDFSVPMDSRQEDRLGRLLEEYRRMRLDPQRAMPKIIVNTPATAPRPSVAERLKDPLAMLAAELADLRPHLLMEDDRVPTVRVQFGTGQVAAAFGCPIEYPTDSHPAVAGPVIQHAADVHGLAMPTFDSGWYPKLEQFTKVFLDHLPPGVMIQHPDIQGPFNNAHLIRGNDVLTDFYDDPKTVETLLDKIVDFTIQLVPWLNRMIGVKPGWFCDWGSFWQGQARISNCSTHMISPEFYREFVLPRDIRLLSALGGGRIHYCGTHGQTIADFCSNPAVTGLDVDPQYHDPWQLAQMVPPDMVLTQWTAADSPMIGRILSGDWPEKRNLILIVDAKDMNVGRRMLADLRQSAVKRFG